jgi:UDP-N-acetylglucosamine--N-acetylmuramyl-(pentapeptide) pyrophosphoryl-undecaprenol N-acetylglucosamine transferase
MTASLDRDSTKKSADTLRTKTTHDTSLRVVIAGGGTGGHLYPGIAVARELLARRPGTQITFAGTAQGLEARVLPREGFALDLIRSEGIKGKSILARARGAWLVPAGLWGAWRIVSRRRPQLVIGVGGYSSGPVVLVAALRGLPTMVLEQNAVPGLTNRLLSRFVGAAAVTFDSTREYFGAKAFVSGNPVRPEFLESVGPLTEAGVDDQPSIAGILVFGGSQGAHAINVAMVEAAEELAADSRLHITHQTGERDVEMVRAAYRSAGVQAEVEPFLYDMGQRLRHADVIVCRAGATTLAEIAAAGKAAILIPLPTATDDHQRRNAEALAATGAAVLLPQSEASGGVLAGRILALVGDRAARIRMARAVRALARPDAAKVIVDRALELIG